MKIVAHLRYVNQETKMADITGTPGNDILLGNDLEGDFITALAGVDKINGGMGGDYILLVTATIPQMGRFNATSFRARLATTP